MQPKVRKGKMISLRLSETEYDALHSLYPSFGARNISDFARLALQRIIGTSLENDDIVLARIHELDIRLKALESQLTSLLQREKAQSCQLTTAS